MASRSSSTGRSLGARGEGFDLVQMMLASPDDWDAYHGLQWLNLRRWLDANPDDELRPELRGELDRAPLDHLVVREHLGGGSSR